MKAESTEVQRLLADNGHWGRWYASNYDSGTGRCNMPVQFSPDHCQQMI